MKGINKILLFFLMIISSSCTPTFKALLSVKDPKVETDQSIQDYLRKIENPIHKHFVFESATDSIEIYQNIMSSFDYEPHVFLNGKKYCYIGQSNCPNIMISELKEFESSYGPCVNDTLSLTEFVSNLRPIADLEEIIITEDHIYIFFYWSIFHKKKKYKKEHFNRLAKLCVDGSSNCKVFLINTDLNSQWGLTPGKRIKMKFKMKGSKSVELKFGKIPYQAD